MNIHFHPNFSRRQPLTHTHTSSFCTHTTPLRCFAPHRRPAKLRAQAAERVITLRARGSGERACGSARRTVHLVVLYAHTHSTLHFFPQAPTHTFCFKHALTPLSLLHADVRRNYARKQQRELLPSELEEAERELAALQEAQSSDTGLVVNQVGVIFHTHSLYFLRSVLAVTVALSTGIFRIVSCICPPFAK